ncbi:MAG: hypothetical protein NZM07_11950 [Elioraea sp.]|nr:hypothetical protein [Elioraea sp.]
MIGFAKFLIRSLPSVLVVAGVVPGDRLRAGVELASSFRGVAARGARGRGIGKAP